MNAISAFIGIGSAAGLVATAIWPPLNGVDRLEFPVVFAMLFFIGIATANARTA